MSLMYVGKKHGLKNIFNLWLCVLLWGLCCNLKVVCGSHMNCHFVSPETNNAIQSAIPPKWVGHTHELSFCEFGKLIIRWLKVPFHSPKNEFWNLLYSNSWIAQGYVAQIAILYISPFSTLSLNLELKYIFVLWKERHCAKESKHMGGNLD
jgi:hypothetical protein